MYLLRLLFQLSFPEGTQVIHDTENTDQSGYWKLKETVVNAILLCLAHLPKMLMVTAMNLLPVLLAVVLPQALLLLGFVWLVCGFALMSWYDITVIEKIFAPYRAEA